ncbi:hypothetical protein [Lysinibacillus sp. FJAT-14745]|uniref:hypothetical protein n=1 Tax=Lysinibacillus sp. FJAT-14745 TaxID=1704289 RepID=UPI000A50423C|nr:hypothetical protein [Lysinibacillus sp. FJAT-14745]
MAIAVLGGKPTARSAGNEINPPPPTIAFNFFQQMSFVAKAKCHLQVLSHFPVGVQTAAEIEELSLRAPRPVATTE